MPNIPDILSKNGFTYHKNPSTDSYIIEDIAIYNLESKIKYIDVGIGNYVVYINFTENIIPDKPNFGLYLDINGYNLMAFDKYLFRSFETEYDFIDELQRLNSIGQNIKG